MILRRPGAARIISLRFGSPPNRRRPRRAPELLMNKIEEYKNEKDGLDTLADLPRFVREGWESISEGDRERLKWLGIFFRRRTPGHFMMRVRIPNGMTNSSRCRALADLCDRSGKGFLDITTRQQVQLRWFKIEDVPQIWEQLGPLGLSSLQTGMDNIRNIVGCPLAGVTPHELLDASSVVRQLTETIVGNKAYTNLPRKFNVTITGCQENCTHAESQDLALVPATKEIDGNLLAGFNVQVGGKLGSGGYRIATPLDVFATSEDAAEVSSAIILIYRDFGFRESRNKARLAFLVDEWGAEKFRDTLEERLGRALRRAGVDARTGRSADHLGVFRQKQPGLNSVGLCVPVGRVTSNQLREAARLAEVYGNGEVRLTVDQNLILPHVHDQKLGELTAEPLLRELRYEPSGVMRGLVSCTGIDYCNLALIETKNRALAVARSLEQKLPRMKSVTMHWSGCPAGCGNHHLSDIGLQGKKARVDGQVIDAVDIFVGGSSGQRPNMAIKLMEDVPCEDLEQILQALMRYGTFDAIREQLQNHSLVAGHAPQPKPLVQVDTEAPIRPEQIAEGQCRAVKLNGLELAVFRLNGQLCGLQNKCPHEGAPLADGTLEGDEIVCPMHSYRFNVRTGHCSTDPGLRARTWRLIERDGRLAIDQEG